MRPLVLQSHTRPLTRVRYNRDGDLLFTTGKDKHFNVFYAHNGEQLGDYQGHGGAINDFAISYNTECLLSGAADGGAILWDAETGQKLHGWDTHTVVKTVGISTGDKYGFLVADNRGGEPARVIVVSLRPGDDHDEEIAKFFPPEGTQKITVAAWGPLNECIYTGHNDGFIRKYEAFTGRMLHEIQAHRGEITDLQWSPDMTYFITSSKDHSAKLWNTELEQLKTYQSDRPVNSATICPRKEHVILAGGQEARDVTTTSAKQGRFQSRFFHKIFEMEIGRVAGHFGPVNSVIANPDGKSFATGGEEG